MEIQRMASLDRDQVIAYLSALSPDELQDLVLELEERLGLERLATWPWGHELIGEDIGIPSFDVVLLSAETARIPVIKALRARVAVGLKEARDLVDRCPVLVGERLDREDAIELQRALEAAGGRAEIR